MIKQASWSSFLVVVVLVLASGPSASATTLTSPEGETPTIKAESEGETVHHSVVDIKCQKSTLEGKVESHVSGVPTKGNLSSLTFSSCGNNHTTVLKPGSLELYATSGGNGTVKSTGAEISVNVTSLGITCVFTTKETHIGTLTGSTSTNATVHIEKATILRTGGSPFCGSIGEWTGSYKVTGPAWLAVDLV